jgi:HEAT repeat protein
MSFAVGCGTEEPTSTADVAPPQVEESLQKPAAQTALPATSVKPLEAVVSEVDSSQAQMPELLIPVPTTSAMDAEVRPAAAIGLPVPDSVPQPAASHPQAAGALKELAEAYRAGQPDRWTRAEAAIHAQGSAALPALSEGLASPDRQTRELSSMMLAQILPNLLYAENSTQRLDVTQVAAKLRQSLGDESAEVRVNVAVALSLMEGEGPALVPVLQELLGSELPHVRTMAVSALGNLGAPAAKAVPAIERLSQSDSDPTAKAAALEALSHLRPLQ